ncbi:transmembrane gamma-carboxyglutamic acid protein 3 [Rhynchocyon petersi]
MLQRQIKVLGTREIAVHRATQGRDNIHILNMDVSRPPPIPVVNGGKKQALHFGEGGGGGLSSGGSSSSNSSGGGSGYRMANGEGHARLSACLSLEDLGRSSKKVAVLGKQEYHLVGYASFKMELWKGHPNAVYSVRDPVHSSDVMYVVVPLLGVGLLIVIALFIIWRCQLQKAARHHPSYTQNRYLASRTGHSLPRVMVYRGTVHGPAESLGHRGAGSYPQVVVGPSRGGRATVRLQSTLYLPELSLSRLGSATPPPSYEEVTASQEEASVTYSDPPPKYEEIVASNPGSDK